MKRYSNITGEVTTSTYKITTDLNLQVIIPLKSGMMPQSVTIPKGTIVEGIESEQNTVQCIIAPCPESANQVKRLTFTYNGQHFQTTFGNYELVTSTPTDNDGNAEASNPITTYTLTNTQTFIISAVLVGIGVYFLYKIMK
jgi:hypothetical protein